jgi:hypothetical protein
MQFAMPGHDGIIIGSGYGSGYVSSTTTVGVSEQPLLNLQISSGSSVSWLAYSSPFVGTYSYCSSPFSVSP